jgi:hypothetical protein
MLIFPVKLPLKMNKTLILLVPAFLFLSPALRAQYISTELIQFSGITLTVDSLNPVPFTRIQVKNTRKGTTSDMNGYFSFVAHRSDTILFNALGFKPASFIIPDTVTKSRYSLIQLMTADTLTLSEAVIFPWPTLEDFKRAFVSTNVPDDDMARAKKNLDPAAYQMQLENTPLSGPANYMVYIENQTSKLYYYGQQQPFTIFNPFAWAKFIKAWKEGKFKRKTNQTND